MLFRFTLTVTDINTGLSACVYDEVIVLVYFCSDIVILLLTGKGAKTSGKKEICTTHDTIMLIISLSLILILR